MDQSKPSLRAVFNEAAEIIDPAARAVFLDSACKGNQALRERVERLLAADSRAGDFMADRAGAESDLVREAIGERIGRYRLVERIGRGGFGTVYLAEQEEPLRRHVALKVLKLGMDTQSFVARFEAERQALALMEHPNIAKVLDAGATDAGRPFFVMELVRGVPITNYCDQNGLSVRQRLELFIPICHAVQHAHQKGIVHRDLKPSNILVVEQDGVAVPKVIDFGIAKATGQESDKQAGLTSENQFIGTPAYMSPEQVGFGGHDVDTRSDIYSLGVILYELLTGQPPFHPNNLLQSGLDEMRRIIREVDPPRPSTTLTKNVDPSRLPSAKGLVRERLAAVRGDMDWIAMKCLEKDRARRYETANGLAMDVRRHLENEPVIARPPSQIYRWQKIVRRHRLGFGAVGAIALILVAAVIVSTQLALRARRAERDQGRLRNFADTKADESRQRLVRRYVAEANRLVEQRRPVTALPWMVEALKLETGDPLREAEERLRIAQALVGAPQLRLHVSQGQWVHCVALSPDGNRLASGSDDGVVRISNVSSGGDVGTNLVMPGMVATVCFSPDGTRVVAVAKSGTARAWNAASGEAITPLLRAQDFNEKDVVKWLAPAATFSPDGKLLLLAFGSKSAQLRDAVNGTLLREFIHSQVVYHATFSPDGRWVVTSSKDATACVWETATGKPAAPPLQHSDMVAWAQFSSDGSKVMTVRDRHFVQLWDWRQGQRLGKEIPRRSELSHASLNSHNSKILTVAASGYAHVYDAASSQLINQFLHHGSVMDAAFSPDGRYIATASHDGNVWVRETDDTVADPMVLPAGNQIEQIAFSSDGRLLAVACRGGHARVWDLFPPQPGVRRLPGNNVACVQFEPSARRALVLSTGGQSGVSVYDAQAGTLVSTAKVKTNQVTRARFSPDGHRFVAFGKANSAFVFDANSGRRSFPPLAHERRVQDAVWSPDGKFILTAAGAAGAHAWDAATGKIAVHFQHSNSVRAIAISPDSKRFATGHDDRTVRLWEASTGRLLAGPLDALETIRQLQFSPDGRRLAISTYARGTEGIVQVRDVGSGEVIGRPLIHRDEVNSIEFSRDGRWLATACEDHSARVWDADTGEPISPWLPHDYETLQAMFSPDGTKLVTLARRGATRLWNAQTGEPITAPIIYTRNEGDGDVSYGPDGQRLLIARGGNEAWLRDLQPEAATLEELKLRAEVLSCTRFDHAAGMVPLDEAGLNGSWQQLRRLRAGK